MVVLEVLKGYDEDDDAAKHCKLLERVEMNSHQHSHHPCIVD